ncbi:MAG: hypothetical protein KDA96_05350 [Planctomycetaceae bacterium]|nr:hypothetical protein [Planctomycetaceae bacterium]
MTSFEDLAKLRKDWIETVLRPWCRQASLKDLRKAEAEWFDIAGRADTAATLWTWAWERFEQLTHPDMAGVNETHRVQVTLRDGSQHVGFPDSRISVRGMLTLFDRRGNSPVNSGPFPVDQILQVELAPLSDD